MSPEEIDEINRLTVLTVRQAAFLANIAKGTLYSRWRKGDGPQSFRIGKCRRVKRADLDRWIAGLARK